MRFLQILFVIFSFSGCGEEARFTGVKSVVPSAKESTTNEDQQSSGGKQKSSHSQAVTSKNQDSSKQNISEKSEESHNKHSQTSDVVIATNEDSKEPSEAQIAKCAKGFKVDASDVLTFRGNQIDVTLSDRKVIALVFESNEINLELELDDDGSNRKYQGICLITNGNVISIETKIALQIDKFILMSQTNELDVDIFISGSVNKFDFREIGSNDVKINVSGDGKYQCPDPGNDLFNFEEVNCTPRL